MATDGRMQQGDTEAGSYLRLIDFCITQLKAQGPSRTCNESKEEVEEVYPHGHGRPDAAGRDGKVRQDQLILPSWFRV